MRALTTIRRDISKIQNDIQKLNATLPPQSELIAVLKNQLEQAQAAWNQTLERASQAVACGESVELFDSYHQADRQDVMLGMSVAALGIDTVLADVLANSQKYANPNTVRMTLADKNKELAELRVALYELTREEQSVIGDEAQRDDVHPAAVLGVPLSILQAHPKYTFATS